MKFTNVELGNGDNLYTLIQQRALSNNVYTKLETQQLVGETVKGYVTIRVVATIAERDAILSPNGFVLVTDASADTSIESTQYKSAIYAWATNDEALIISDCGTSAINGTYLKDTSVTPPIFKKVENLEALPDEYYQVRYDDDGNYYVIELYTELSSSGSDSSSNSFSAIYYTSPFVNSYILPNVINGNWIPLLGSTILPVITGGGEWYKVMETEGFTEYALKWNNIQDKPTTLTLQGNTFNGASQLVQLDASSKLPAVDGSQITGLAKATTTTVGVASFSSTHFSVTDGAVSLSLSNYSGSSIYLNATDTTATFLSKGNSSLTSTEGTVTLATSAASGGNIILQTATSSTSYIQFQTAAGAAPADVKLGSAGLNTANGLVKLDGSGKIPSSTYTTVNLASYMGSVISLESMSDGITLRSSGGGNISLTTGTNVANIILTTYGSSYIQLKDNGGNAPSDVKLGSASLNAANGLVKLDASAQLARSMIKPNSVSTSSTVTTSKSIDASAYDIHRIVLTASTECVLTISNLVAGAAVVVRCDNSAGGILTYNSAQRILAADVGVYYLTFANTTGSVDYLGKSLVEG